jgi:DNA-binding transcriptional regulator YiaG
MPRELSFKEALEQRAATEEGAPHRSAFPTIRLLLTSGPISRPVDLIRLLAERGLSLKKARSVVDRLGAGERVPVELNAEPLTTLVHDLERLGVVSRSFRDLRIDVKQVREGQHLSQAEFAALYGLELDTLQNWEQGRNTPDNATTVLFAVIEQSPLAVLEAITKKVTESAG